MSLLGVDVGTTGLKVAAINQETGAVLASAYREYTNIYDQPGQAQLDAELVWAAFLEVVRLVNSDAQVLRDPVQAMSFSVSGDEITLVGRDGHPLDDTILASDTRGFELLTAVREVADEHELFRLTGQPPYPLYPLVRLLWYQRYRPDLLAQTHKVLGWADYIIWKMGLPAVTDYGNAARWMAFDIRECHWLDWLFDALELSMDPLPKPQPAATPVGEVPAAIASSLGFKRSVEVCTGTWDQICSAIGGGLQELGDCAISTGTWECVAALVEDPPSDVAALRRAIPYANFVTADRFIGLASNAGGGSLLRWFRDEFGREEKSQAAASGEDVYDLLLAQAPSHPTDILLLPHFQGSYNPWMDTESLGAVVGLTLSTTRGQFIRAILEGAAFELRANMDRLREAGSTFGVLRNTGGGSRSRLWTQLKADVLGYPVETLDAPEAGCLTAAILAGVGCGYYRNFAEPLNRFTSVRERFEPRAPHVARYEALYGQYRSLYPTLAPISHALHHLGEPEVPLESA